MLKSGHIIVIVPHAEIGFHSEKVETLSLEQIEIESPDTFTVLEYASPYSSRRAIAGQDFPAEVYDIIYEPKEAEEWGSVECKILDPSMTREMMTCTVKSWNIIYQE